MAHPMGESKDGVLKLDFDRRRGFRLAAAVLLDSGRPTSSCLLRPHQYSDAAPRKPPRLRLPQNGHASVKRHITRREELFWSDCIEIEDDGPSADGY